MSQPNLPADESRIAIACVREELARRRMSRQRLADEAKISVSTLEKVLSGRRPFTLATLVRLEDSLGISLRAMKPALANGRDRSSVAPDELGNYARPSVAWLEGSYLTLMPSFGEKAAISAYRTEIAWDDTQSCLSFRESDRADAAFTHFGCVSMPNQTGHIYLVTNRHGQQRLAILARPTRDGVMHGVLSTLYSGRGAQLTPVAAPIVLTPLTGKAATSFGRIATGHADYARYRTLLKRTIEEGFAVFMGI